MADIKPPKTRKKDDKKPSIEKKAGETVALATPKKPTDQTPPETIKPLQLKIPETRKNEFKAYAALRGRSMNALFLDMFDEYKEKHA